MKDIATDTDKESDTNSEPVIKSSKAHPTDRFIKSRRVLVTYAGLLILLTAHPSDTQNSGEVLQKIESIWPIKFDPPLFILNPHLVVFCLMIYAIWRYFSEWHTQLHEVRNAPIGRADCIVTGIIVTFAGTFFYKTTNYFPAWDCPLIFPAIVFFTLVAWWFAFIKITELLYEHAVNMAVKNEEKIIEKIKAHKMWKLTYNPKITDGGKDIEFCMAFGPGGISRVIGEGRNSNEYSWRERDKYLEIFKQNGRIHNRFKYNDSKKIFESTNDSDVAAIGRQFIHPKPSGKP